MKTKLTAEQQDMIDQVAATMSISNMPLTDQCYADLIATLTGEKTEEEVIVEIKQRYTKNQ